MWSGSHSLQTHPPSLRPLFTSFQSPSLGCSWDIKQAPASGPFFPSSWNFICPGICIANPSPSKNLCSSHHFTDEVYLFYRFLIKESSSSDLFLFPLPRTSLELYPFWPAPVLASRTAILRSGIALQKIPFTSPLWVSPACSIPYFPSCFIFLYSWVRNGA